MRCLLGPANRSAGRLPRGRGTWATGLRVHLAIAAGGAEIGLAHRHRRSPTARALLGCWILLGATLSIVAGAGVAAAGTSTPTAAAACRATTTSRRAGTAAACPPTGTATTLGNSAADTKRERERKYCDPSHRQTPLT
jgi:hypothetical protein